MKKNNINVEIEQQKKLKQIGSHLQKIRLEQDISLETIAKQTLISIRLLQAIEAGDTEELPQPVYTQALIKKFARAINAEEVDLDLNVTSSVSSTQFPTSSSRWRFEGFHLRSVHLYLIYIVLIGVSVRGITAIVESPTIVNQMDVEEVIPSNPSVAINNSSPQNNQSMSISQLVSKSNQPQSVIVDIALKDRCWLKVMVDGKIEFEGTLPKGTRRKWVGSEQVILRAGNAGGVVVTYSDGRESLLGQPGQVQEVTFDAVSVN